MFRIKIFAAVAAIGLILPAVAACAGPSGETGTLEVYVTDAPPGGQVTGIMVTVDSLDVHRAGADENPEQTVSSNQTEPPEPTGGEWISISISEDAATFDLLDVAGVEKFLGASQLEASKYTQVRLAVKDISVEFNDSGQFETASVPSSKLRIAHPFTISGNSTTVLVVDFDASRMVTVTGNGKVMVKPVVKLTTRRQGPPTLEDTRWQLVSYGDSDNTTAVLEGSDVYAEFMSADMRVTGRSGCNSYFGDYTIDGNKLSLSGSLAYTEMACLNPEGVMDQEQAYLTILGQAETYKVAGKHMTITGGGQVLNFEAE